MVHVKNQVHCLRVKWFHCLCADVGSSWSWFIWPVLTEIIPVNLLTGLCRVSERILSQLPLFYAQIVCSYICNGE